jgi:hypothetical protein
MNKRCLGFLLLGGFLLSLPACDSGSAGPMTDDAYKANFEKVVQDAQKGKEAMKAATKNRR